MGPALQPERWRLAAARARMLAPALACLMLAPALACLILPPALACNGEQAAAPAARRRAGAPLPGPERGGGAYAGERDERAAPRSAMVDDQLAARGIRDPRVLAAMRTVPRHAFVPAELAAHAYEDTPLPIGEGQTISQPYIVAAMTELAAVGPRSRVLEIGTGSGYQAAVLAEIAGEVYSIEINEVLARRAAAALSSLGYGRVHLRTGDGYRGWPEAAPFDAIVVTAAPPQVPEPLRQQLAVGGRLVLPVGDTYQELVVLTRRDRDHFTEQHVFPVMFVPMIGEAQRQPAR